MTLRLPTIALLVLAAAPASQATAQAPSAEDVDRARRLFESGRELLEAEEWEAGLDVLRRSFEIVERASVAYSMAFALVRLERPDEALEVLDRFDAIADPDQDASLLEGAARLRLSAASMRPAPAAAPPADRATSPPGGPEPIQASAPRGPDGGGALFAAGITSSAVAGLALVVGVTFTALAAAEQDRFDATPTHEIADRGEAFAATSYVSWAVLAAAGLTATITFALDATP